MQNPDLVLQETGSRQTYSRLNYVPSGDTLRRDAISNFSGTHAKVKLTKINEINHCFFTGNKDVSHKRMAKQFSSCSIEQEEQLNNGDQIREDLAKIFEQHCPQSCFLALYNNKPEVPVELSVPKAPMEIAKELRLKKGASLEHLMEAMTLTKQDTDILCTKTTGQAENTIWKQQRVGRCTGSRSQRIYTRSKTLMKNPKTDVTSLMKDVMGYSQTKQTKAMKHGLSMEPNAKAKFEALMKIQHKGYRQCDTGLHVMADHPFIAASPDLICSCDCHETAIAEIKCPLIFDQDITPSTYNHLQYTEKNEVRLSPKSPYFFQIQHTMGVTGYNKAHFFVYTPKKCHHELVNFNAELWCDMVSKFTHFWKTCVANEMLTGTLFQQIISSDKVADGHNYSKEGTASDVAPPSTSVTGKTVLQHKKLPTIFLCLLCGKELPDEPTTEEEESVECSSCSMWFHISCTGEEKTAFSGNWKCFLCLK